MRILSLGAGVQSTTLALMAARGELEPIDAAIFADTQWEPAAVYAHLAWLETQLPFPVHRVTEGNLRQAALDGVSKRGARFDQVPWFTLTARGKPGMGRRECTGHYKVEPVRRKIRDLLGGGKLAPGACELVIGISSDEMQRMRRSPVAYIVNRYPLFERRMSRRACLRWLEERQFPRPPKSSCIGCPFHGNEQWRSLTKAEFADAVEVDRAIRHRYQDREQFMHQTRQPLEQVDLQTLEDKGQGNLFDIECEGMCGI